MKTTNRAAASSPAADLELVGALRRGESWAFEPLVQLHRARAKVRRELERYLQAAALHVSPSIKEGP